MRIHPALSATGVSASVTARTCWTGKASGRVTARMRVLGRAHTPDLSYRKTGEKAEVVRPVGCGHDHAHVYTPTFIGLQRSAATDRNGLVWETFNTSHQAREIRAAWGDAGYDPQ